MDRDRLIELVPHYVAMLLSLFVVLFAMRALVGETSFWIELLVVLVVSSLYRPAVQYLGIAPSAWQRQSR